MPTIAVRPAAGVGAVAQIQADATGLSGRLRILTGSSGVAAGALAVVTLDIQPVADLDAAVAASVAVYGPGATNAASFSSAEVLVTPWTVPPVGCAFQVVAQLAQGVLAGFALAATLALQSATEYRFGWRIFV